MLASHNGARPVSGALSLSFDDGPGRASTPRVLAALGRLGAGATFFMLGERVRAAPELARAVRDAGFDVQLHADRHIRHSELDERAIERDARAALDAFAAIELRPTRWRTPWGVVTAASERVAARHGLALTGWTIDTHDWRGDSPAAMLAAARPRLLPRAVVLMHDALGPGSRRANVQNTLGLLEPLIAEARARRLSVEALPPAASVAGPAPAGEPAPAGAEL